MQILADNSILVLGRSAGNVALAKYTSTGALDLSFNTTGKKIFTIPMGFISASGLETLPKVKVLSTGSILISCSDADFKVIKLDSSGNYDNTFAINGVFTSNSETDLSVFLQIKSNGNIITGGISYTTAINSDAKIKEVELTHNGVLINTVTKLLLLGVEKYLVMSKNNNGDFFVLANTPNTTLSKYNSAGQLDTSFGVGGIVNITNNYNSLVESCINVFSDKIFVSFESGIYKFNSNGSLDSSFDGDGFIDLDLALKNINSNYSLSYMDDFKIDSNGNLVIALDFVINSPFQVSMAIMKFLNNGTIDSAFGNNGLFTTRFNSDINYQEYPCRILFQNDSKIKIVGISINNSTNDRNFCVFRLNSNGSLDTTFGDAGKILQTLANLYNWPLNSYIFNDNSMMCFMYDQAHGEIKSIKFLADGTIDLSHGTNGIANDVAGTINSSMVLQSDGKYLKAGVKNNHFSISRYNLDGSVDNTFGTNGEVNTAIGAFSSISEIFLAPDGKIVVGGTSSTSDNQLSVLARFTNTTLGTLDFSSTKSPLSIYPNPIETNATFEFTLENSENITIELYDVQGKLVQTIATNKQMASGNHNLPIELNQSLTSGNYFLKLATANGSQTIQIIKK